MKIYILSLFPNEMREYFFKGIFKRGYEAGLFDIEFVDIRAYAQSKHNKVDDYPFGYKKGLILKADVIKRAILSIDNYQDYRLLYTCPKGRKFDQATACEFKRQKGLIIIAGYYEGMDERVFELFDIEKISIGDFVLSTGELPALMMTEAVLRQIPGVVGKEDCVQEDSIISGLLECPQYTQPRIVDDLNVPAVLLDGHHKKMNAWRKKMAIKETLFNKPSLFMNYKLDVDEQQELLTVLRENEDEECNN
jgi:tRNA (guanine37-N1)-methyltransferase